MNWFINFSQITRITIDRFDIFYSSQKNFLKSVKMLLK